MDCQGTDDPKRNDKHLDTQLDYICFKFANTNIRNLSAKFENNDIDAIQVRTNPNIRFNIMP